MTGYFIILAVGGIALYFKNSQANSCALRNGYRRVMCYATQVRSYKKYYGEYLTVNHMLALMATESMGNHLAVGDTTLKNPAFGLFQIRYPAYADSGFVGDFDLVKTDPAKNIKCACMYMGVIIQALENANFNEAEIPIAAIMSWNIGYPSIISGNFDRDKAKKYYKIFESKYTQILNWV